MIEFYIEAVRQSHVRILTWRHTEVSLDWVTEIKNNADEIYCSLERMRSSLVADEYSL